MLSDVVLSVTGYIIVSVICGGDADFSLHLSANYYPLGLS